MSPRRPVWYFSMSKSWHTNAFLHDKTTSRSTLLLSVCLSTSSLQSFLIFYANILWFDICSFHLSYCCSSDLVHQQGHTNVLYGFHRISFKLSNRTDFCKYAIGNIFTLLCRTACLSRVPLLSHHPGFFHKLRQRILTSKL